MFMQSSVAQILTRVKDRNYHDETTFFQAVEEVVKSIRPLLDDDPRYEKNNVLDRLLTPDRIITFKVVWLDDNNHVQVNKGYRVQFNNALGPYKGGLRFHPSVNVGILKFLAFEQIFKNSLTGLMIGGAKGGSDFDPKGKSDFEIMRFSSAFMTEMHKYIGPRMDVPAGDIGVGAREIGYLFGEYKKVTSRYEGVLTGKPFMFGGSLMRPEATGYGVVFFTQALLEFEQKESLEGKVCTVSGAGNVAIYTIEKLQQLGAIVVSCSDSTGTLYDSRGIDLELLKVIKFEKRARLDEYLKVHQNAQYVLATEYPKDGHFVWSIPAYAAFPCATQNELTLEDAKALVKNKVSVVAEGANMPSTLEATNYLIKHGVSFAPAKAANAGGVAVSEFEMSQNASLQRWSFEKVEAKLKETMQQICKRVVLTAKDYGQEGNYVNGANIAGFKRVADAMIAEGF